MRVIAIGVTIALKVALFLAKKVLQLFQLIGVGILCGIVKIKELIDEKRASNYTMPTV